MARHQNPTPFDELTKQPPNAAMLMSAYHFRQARVRREPMPDQLTAERELRVAIDDLITNVPCECDCGDNPQICECPRCVTWFQNRVALEELGLYPEGLRPATSLRHILLKDSAALVDDLRRLTTEGTRGRNLLVVSNGDAFVQFAQFLEPMRDSYLTCEVASDKGLFVPYAADYLDEVGFSPPTAPHYGLGEGDDLIQTTQEDEYPLFHRHLYVYDDPEEAMHGIAELTTQLLRRVFGLSDDATLELELHIEAGV